MNATHSQQKRRTMKRVGEEDGRSKIFTPIVPRLDRIDSLMRHLEEKQKRVNPGAKRAVEGLVQSSQVQRRTLASAIREVHRKCTLLDRVGSLENRLFQLRLGMEARDATGSSMMHKPERLDYRFGKERRLASHSINSASTPARSIPTRMIELPNFLKVHREANVPPSSIALYKSSSRIDSKMTCRVRRIAPLRDFLAEPTDDDDHVATGGRPRSQKWLEHKRWFSIGC